MKKVILWIIAIIVLCDITALFLLAAAIAVPNIYWEMQLRNIFADMKKRGEPTSWKDFKKPPVPDNENAAVTLKEAFALMKEPKDEVSGGPLNKRIEFVIDKWPSDNSKIAEIIKWPEPVKKEVSEILSSEKLKNIFAKLQEATLKPAFSFNLNYEHWIEKLPGFSNFRVFVKLLCINAFLESEKGNMDVAGDNLITALKSAQYCDSEPVVVCNIIKISLVNNVIYSANAIIARYGISEKNAVKLLEQLNKIDADENARNAFRGEKCLVTIPEFMNLIKTGGAYESFFEWCLINKIIEPIRARIDFIAYLKAMSAFDKLYVLFPWERQKEYIKIKEQIPGYCFVSKSTISVFEDVFPKYCMFMTDIAKLKLNLALRIYKERNGKYPDSLEELKPSILEKIPVNYTNGQEFFYKNNGSDFILKE